MAGKSYRLSRQAVQDLESIADYLGSRNPHAADRVLNTLENAFELLANNPELGITRNDLYTGIRLFVPAPPAAHYAIFFYPTSDRIEISDVIHAARDWVGLFARDER